MPITHVVKEGQWPSVIAQLYTGSQGRWPELCAANPQCPKHTTYGCIYKTGDVLNLPAGWIATPSADAPADVNPGGSTTPGSATQPTSPAALLKSPLGIDPELAKKLLLGAGILGFALALYFGLRKPAEEEPPTLRAPQHDDEEALPSTLRSEQMFKNGRRRKGRRHRTRSHHG